jgi:hypothetical protein
VYETYLFFVLLFAAILLFMVVAGKGQVGSKTRGVRRGVYSEQMEVDLRLTYKRFKELYPFSQISYQDYKKLQMERAFRRAVSSEKNKRMVR